MSKQVKIWHEHHALEHLPPNCFLIFFQIYSSPPGADESGHPIGYPISKTILSTV